MDAFQTRFADSIIGQVTTTDRMILKGHLTGFFPEGAFARFLWQERIPLKEFGAFALRATEELKAHAMSMAAAEGRPFEYLAKAQTPDLLTRGLNAPSGTPPGGSDIQ